MNNVRRLLPLLIALTIGSASPVFAAPAASQREALALYKQGMKLYRRGDYRAAIETVKRDIALPAKRCETVFPCSSKSSGPRR